MHLSGHDIEDNEHHLLHCPLYLLHRNMMLQKWYEPVLACTMCMFCRLYKKNTAENRVFSLRLNTFKLEVLFLVFEKHNLIQFET